MFKPATTVASAAILAGLTCVMWAGGVHAGTLQAAGGTAVSPQAATSEATDARATSAGCAQRAWPYYAQGCQSGFDARWHGEPRKARLVTTDRLN